MTAPSIIIVTGSRHAVGPLDAAEVHGTLDAFVLGGDTLYVGDARGVDTLAAWWARENNIACQRFSADWTRLDKAAGPERNERMVAAALALRDTHRLIGLAFPGPKSSGTWDCVRRMRAAGIDVHTWEVSE